MSTSPDQSDTQRANFVTDDMALAIFLHLEDYKFTVYFKGKRGYFVFAFADDLYQAVDDFHEGCVEVEPREFMSAQKHCRDVLLSARRAARDGDGDS